MNTIFLFINNINLVFHEGGHMIFRILGIEFLTVLGGTLMQLAIPAAAFAHFFVRKQKFAGALMGLWFGENFLMIGEYMKDAIVQQLPLIGDGTHDWTYLFGALGVLQYCKGIGSAAIVLGYAVMAGASAWIIALGLGEWTKKSGTVSALILVFLAVGSAHASPPRLSCEELFSVQNATNPKTLIIDVRAPADYLGGHIPGARNILATKIRSENLPRGVKIVLYCGGNTCEMSENAASDLMSAGYHDVFVLDGGISAWEKKGYLVLKGEKLRSNSPAPMVSVEEVKIKSGGGNCVLLDVRTPAEFAAGHLPGAVSIPLEQLEKRKNEVLVSMDVFVYDRLNARSRTSAEMLSRAGYHASEIRGGIMAWIKNGYALEMAGETR